jgi:sn-glycerol 3-phosphate transport system substrate-binding protein
VIESTTLPFGVKAKQPGRRFLYSLGQGGSETMVKDISRRSLLKRSASVAAGAAAVGTMGKASSVFAAPALVQSTGSTVELNYWTAFGSGVNGGAQTALIDAFHAAQSDIKIVATPHENYEALANALVAGLQVDEVPDVAVLSDVWWFNFYANQAIADLTPLFTAETAPDDYVQSLFTEYSRNGGQWAVPFARSTPLLYYNKTAVEKAGLTGDIFATWDSLVENAPTLISGGGVTSAFAFGNAASYGAWVLHGPVWAFEGFYSDPDFNILIAEANAVECGEFMRTFVQNGNALTVADPQTDFVTGTIGAILASTGSLGTIRDGATTFEFGTAELPSQAKFGCCTGGAGLSIVASAPDEKKAAAMKFLEFSTSTDVTTTWSQTTGYMPVRTSAIESEAEQTFLAANPNNAVAIGQLPKTQPQDSARVFIPGGDQILGRGWEQVLVNDVPAQEAFDEVKATLDQEKEAILEQIAAIEG